MYKYHCILTYGNLSTLENKEKAEIVEAFLKSFEVKDFTIEMNPPNEEPSFVAFINFEHRLQLKRDHFMRAIVAFSLFHAIGINELEYPNQLVR